MCLGDLYMCFFFFIVVVLFCFSFSVLYISVHNGALMCANEHPQVRLLLREGSGPCPLQE